MSARRFSAARLLLCLSLLLTGLLATSPLGSPTAAANPAQSVSERWIVRLDAPPLVQAPITRPEFSTLALPVDASGKPDLYSPAAQTYRSQLQQQQAALLATMQQQFPGLQMHRSYQTIFNGLGVVLPNASEADIRRLEALPGVAAVYPDELYELQMFSSVEQINAPALWESDLIGGQANAGAGLKIAIIDAGIRTDNPFFNPEGYSYPEGYPVGETDYTTPKVIAARAYFRPDIAPIPGHETPEPGPLDSSHGTHVAGTAAGVASTPATFAGITRDISGVAPQAYLMNYKTFYANESVFSGAFSIELIAALEDAVLDGADVINNSWGGLATLDPAFNPIAQAAEAAVDAGVTVVFAAGNAGPNPSTAGSPAYSDKLISVGASSKAEIIAAGRVDVVAPGDIPAALTERPFGPANFGEPIRDRIVGPAPFLPVVLLDGDGLACTSFPPDSLSGQIALIERGTCQFSVKVANVQDGGAIAAIIYNSEEGGDEVFGMAGGDRAEEVVIPAVSVERSMGLEMFNWHSDHGAAALVEINPQGRVVQQTPDVMIEFSSRGPTFQATLKPDVVAPGAGILSAGFAPEEGLEQHRQFGLNSGTSMAAPHVAGAAALIKQVHPDWSPADIKSALMSTAVRQIWIDDDQTIPAGVLEEGAGRIDLSRAATPELVFNPPSLSFGNLDTDVGQPTSRELTVQARNVSNATHSFSLAGSATDGPDFAVSVSPAQLTLGPGEQASFTVSINIPADAPTADYGGTIEVNGPQPLHLPLWARTLPPEPGTKVLLIDNDGSTSLGLRDYSGYYANLLIEQGISTTYLDVDALAPVEQTLPPIGELQRHEIIIWFTGDNFVPSGALGVPTPLTPADQDLLIAYLQSGGSLIATGQDLADASDIEPFPPDPRYGRSSLYGYTGAQWAADDVFAAAQTVERRVEGIGGDQLWTSDITLDLSAPVGVVPSDATGAGNQTTVDEVMLSDADLRAPDEYTEPIFRAVETGNPTDGFVGLNRRDEPTLEKPDLAFPYRSTILSFGLEGVRSDTATTTRKELLQALLYWHVDRPAVTLDQSQVTIDAPGQEVSFTASASSNTPTSFVRYRWDFGDGSPYVETSDPTVTHSYATPGSYQVRVEATNSWGHRALSPTPAATLNAAAQEAATTPEAAVTFAETGHSLEGRFLAFWQQNGGLAVFGYPLTPQQAAPQLRQGFERTRFELHPENAPPYDVLLGHMGVEALQAQGRDWQGFATVEAAPEGCLYFAETQHSLCGDFLSYWQGHGLEFDGSPGSSYAESLALFGLPISEPQQEVLEDGNTYTVQWFERARFEYHPTAEGGMVLLGRLGASE